MTAKACPHVKDQNRHIYNLCHNSALLSNRTEEKTQSAKSNRSPVLEFSDNVTFRAMALACQNLN